jgi:hypothetical protein
MMKGSKFQYREHEVLAVAVVCLLLTAGVIFFTGLVSGRRLVVDSTLLYGNLKPAQPAAAPALNWGAAISIGGKTENVTDYFAAQLNEEDIKNYLS